MKTIKTSSKQVALDVPETRLRLPLLTVRRVAAETLLSRN
jgi:hypothetical protein